LGGTRDGPPAGQGGGQMRTEPRQAYAGGGDSGKISIVFGKGQIVEKD